LETRLGTVVPKNPYFGGKYAADGKIFSTKNNLRSKYDLKLFFCYVYRILKELSSLSGRYGGQSPPCKYYAFFCLGRTIIAAMKAMKLTAPTQARLTRRVVTSLKNPVSSGPIYMPSA